MIDTMPRPEYPRPDFQRKIWLNLNGEWDFADDPKGVGEREEWFNRKSLPDKIVVPFAVESDASGQGRADPPPFLWYLKRFTLPPEMKDRPTLINFGAVDYHARCWLNGNFIGEHRGGYTSFGFDITSFLHKDENVLVVKVEDSRSMLQVRGKQSFLKKDVMIFYRPVSGIWQTVWAESVGQVYLKEVLISPDYQEQNVSFKIKLNRNNNKARLEIKIVDPEGNECGFTAAVTEDTEQSVTVSLKKVFPWSPEKPDLYRVYYTLKDAGGVVCDQVEGYFGWREIAIKGDKIFLNGRPLYQKLLLNQGYYPGGHYTALDDEVLRRDIEMVKEMGYNGIRIHQKIEDKRLLYWCDTLGVLTWAEMPSFYLPSRIGRERLFEEWKQIMRRDFNHPSIITWVPFNESWGVMDLFWKKNTRLFIKKIVEFTRNFDRSRPVIDNSGFDHVDSDIIDIHIYPLIMPSAERFCRMYRRYRGGNMKYGLWGRIFNMILPWIPIIKRPLAPGASYGGQPIIISEYGGFGFYRSRKGKGLEENLRDYTRAIMKEDWICGFCYTQQYDTYQERNGLITFERKYKLPPEIVKDINVLR